MPITRNPRARGALPRPVSGIPDEAAVLRDVRLCVQSAARLHQNAVLRSCRVLRFVGLRHRLAGDGSRLGNDRRDPRGRRGGHAARARDRRDRGAPPGHLFCDDHPGAGAVGVLHLSAGATSPAARMACRASRGAASSGSSLSVRDRTMYYFVLAVFVAVYLFIRRIVHSPFGQVLKAIRANEPRADLAGLQGRPLQTAGLRPVGEHRRSRRLAQGAGSGLRDALGRKPGHLGRGDPDDSARRQRNLSGTGGRRERRRHAAGIPLRCAWAPGSQ